MPVAVFCTPGINFQHDRSFLRHNILSYFSNPSTKDRHGAADRTAKPDPPRHRFAHVHRQRPGPGGGAVQGRHRRRFPRLERPPRRAARHLADGPENGTGRLPGRQPRQKSRPHRRQPDRPPVQRPPGPRRGSVRAPPKEMLDAIHSYGGIVLHDVISIRHAQKALEAGVDGLILVAAGAGGHAGALSPFALVGEVRKFFKGPLILSGAIATGDAILSAQAMGADLAYIGSRWLATKEANVTDEYRQAIVDSTAADVVYTNLFTGVHGNYLKKSIVNAGLDPDNLPEADKTKMNFGSGGDTKAKAWRDIWGAGQAVGLMDDVPTVAEMVDRLEKEYAAARQRLAI